MKIFDVNDKDKFSFNCIYLWTNLINDKKYVGQAQNFYNRMQDYLHGKDKDRVIGKAILKYGIENFEITILEQQFALDKLNEREQYWMDYYQCFVPNGYNVCHTAGNTLGYHHTYEDKEKMSKIAKQRFVNHPELIKKGKDSPMYGRHLSEETKRKMSNSRKGNQNAKGKRWKLNAQQRERRRQTALGNTYCLGRKLTAYHRQRIIESNKTRVLSEDTIKKMSESHKGKATKKVRCIETDMIFNSISEAAIFVGKSITGIIACCKGKQKTCAGYHWEYVI